MKAAIERDAVASAIKAALKAIGAAQREANEDLRTSSGTVCWELDRAHEHIQAAADWLRELAADERAESQRKAEKPKTAALRECGCCEEPIPDDEVSICGGCDKATCPSCMEGEFCRECNAPDEP